MTRVGVSIDHAGYYHATAEVGNLRTVSDDRLRARIIPHVEEFSITDHDRFGPRLIFIDGVDATVS